MKQRLMLIFALSLGALLFSAVAAEARGSRFSFSFSFGYGGGHYAPYYHPGPYRRYYGPVYPAGAYYPGPVLGYRYIPEYRYRVYRAPARPYGYSQKKYRGYQPRRYDRRSYRRH